jgi:hypothetical protein
VPIVFAATPTIKDRVIETFGQESPLVMVAFCESTYRQFNEDGEVLRGKIDKRDVGVFQINEYWHLDESQRLGYDIYTLEGNIGYAKYLYEKSGLKPWSASYPCLKREGVVLTN